MSFANRRVCVWWGATAIFLKKKQATVKVCLCAIENYS